MELAVRERSFDPADMALRGRIGAYVTRSRHDARETTRAARAAFLARFEHAVDPDGVLPEAERLQRAEAAKRAHFTRLARLSVQERSKGRARKKGNAAVCETAAASEGVHGDATAMQPRC
jgi:hypothetical protein